MKAPTWKRLKKALGLVPPVRSLTSDPASRRAARHAADAAREVGDWETAARLYAQALEGDETNLAMHVQRGHALKESGRLQEAEGAYRRALELSPTDAEIWLHLGHLLRVSRRNDEAITAYADALRLNPDYVEARDALVALGGRGRMPHAAYGRSASTERLAQISAALVRIEATAADLAVVSTFPVEAWDAFRRVHETPPPPPSKRSTSLAVWIEARGMSPSTIRPTLDSLLDQTSHEWQAVVICDPALADHPIASLASQDRRVAFSAQPPEPSGPTLLIDGGTVLDAKALSWFARCLELVPSALVYGDHDHHSRHWRAGLVHFDPCLFSAPDADDLAYTPAVPAAVLVRDAPRLLQGNCAVLNGDFRRRLLVAAVERGEVAHLPLVLTSLRRDGPSAELPSETLPPTPAPAADDTRILVIIPTRDQAEMLEKCVDSLRRSARASHAIDILVLDNRSRQPETRALLERLAAAGVARWRTLDEPFNWGRFNNLTAHDAQSDILVFCNNDIEAVSEHWDDVVRADLARADVGLVGARLLYPDGTLQHAGVVMGRGEGRPIHEGLHSMPGEAGPLARWRRRRRLAAVTGAFMAVRRDTFAALGGFDERLAVGYNDIDFCLRMREAGLTVLYDPAITLIHHESKTRGLNEGGERARWDDSELEVLHRRWGEVLFQDISINPRWTSAHSRVFDGFRDVSARLAVDWLKASVGPNPWRIENDAIDQGL